MGVKFHKEIKEIKEGETVEFFFLLDLLVQILRFQWW
jgi:hypothetical protein